ncbi:MAG: hypothetical protein DHS20C21_16640 [Gemmatimonadota bacterium]|nr:MAG: hypothetical protein DHS20C21_16640 [Gemmatimonadota bacterium]
MLSSNCRAHVRMVVAAGLLTCVALPTNAQIFDSDNVVLLSRQDHYTGYNDVWGFVGTDGREYVIQGTTTGTAWWDVDDPTHPVQVQFIAGPNSTWRDMFVIGNYAYVGTEGGGGIQIVDISDPTNPTLVGAYTATVNSCHNIFGDVARELIYVAGGASTGGLQVLDASNPTNLVEVGAWQLQYFHDVSAEGTRVYGSMINQGKFRILDVSVPSAPVALGATFPDASNHASWPLGGMSHVALAAERNGGHIKIVDISDVNNPVLADEDDPEPGTSIHNVHVQGTRMYCSWYVRGTRIYDVADPTNIAEIGYFDTLPEAGSLFAGNWGVYPHLPSGLIVSSDRTHGMFLMRYDPDAARLDGVVSSSAGGPLTGATVNLVTTTLDLVTDATGAYRFAVAPGTWDVQASAFGHSPAVVNLSVGAGGTTTTPIVLSKLPSGGVSGRITDQTTGLPLELVDLAIQGTPLSTTTDANGDYAFPDVPTSPSPMYELEIRAAGYGVPDGSITLQTGVQITRDFALEPAAAYVDFSDPTGWTVTNDPGTTDGFWEFGEPKGTYANGIPVSPEFDHTTDPEDQAAVTGNEAGSPANSDVDGGATRLLSPVYDLSGMLEPHVFYYRWYAVSDVDDAWQTHVTTNGGAQWDLVESTTENQAYWSGIDVDLTPITGSASAVQFRFTCEDQGAGQIIEGALDDFALFDAASGAVDVALPEKRIGLSLSQNYPNPVRRGTRISFSVPNEEHVLLSVFDVTGRRVAVLLDDVVPTGLHAAEWDGRIQGGERAAAGVYFYKLHTASAIETRKLVVVR